MRGTTDTPEGYDVKPLREKLRGWIAGGATLNDLVQIDTNDCYDRATKLIPDKWNVTQTTLNVQNTQDESELLLRLEAQLAKPSFKPGGKVVVLNTRAGWGGAATSRFTGFHYVVIIAVGRDSRNGRFCVVYDPDVTATQRAKDKWGSCGQAADRKSPASEAIARCMVLGGQDGSSGISSDSDDKHLGALIRYVYED
jgi:hypothetical protein